MTDAQCRQAEAIEWESEEFLWENGGRDKFNEAYERQAEFEARDAGYYD